jgi:hypothetical protein
MRSLINSCAVALGILLIEAGGGTIAMGAATLSNDIDDSSGSFRLGMINFTKTDGQKTYTGGASVYNYEYSRYLRLNQALIFGFRQATDSATKRDAYHSAYGGYRFFPMGVGLPILATTGDATISIDSRYKPYAEASLGLGHILFEPIAQGAGDFSANAMGIAFGGGLMMHFFKRWAVDFQIMYEMVQSRGGTSNSLAVSGNNIYILLGNGMTF